MIPTKAPKFKAGHACEARRIVDWLDPQGLSLSYRSWREAGCGVMETAHASVAGPGGSTIAYLCATHFTIFNAVPAD